jgi:hypothetical protein
LRHTCIPPRAGTTPTYRLRAPVQPNTLLVHKKWNEYSIEYSIVEYTDGDEFSIEYSIVEYTDGDEFSIEYSIVEYTDGDEYSIVQ